MPATKGAAAKKRPKTKSPLTKVIYEKIYEDGGLWTVHSGKLKPGPGHPGKTKALFKVVGEKLPFEALPDVRKHLAGQSPDGPPQGVYVAHDSMGCPRYIGRGDIFTRLKARRAAQPLELAYFSFYVVADKKHEREVETLLIRAAGFLLEFNDRKKRVSIAAGSVKDYEAGTFFYERHWKKGRAASA